MAEWIVDGAPSIDLRESDINRFDRHVLNREYIRTRANQQYIEVYDIIHPLDQTMAPRNLRLSPFHARQVELGAHFFESAGWERPQWYAANADELARRGAPWPERTGWTARNWSPIVGAEHLAARERVALFDMTPFTKLEVRGPGALRWLQWLAANQMDQPIGKVTYTAMLTVQGGIRCDLTVTRLAADRFMVITGGASGMHDLAWLRQQLPRDGSVMIQDLSSAQCCIGLWGPRAHALIHRVSEDDFSFPYFTARTVTIGHVPVLAARVSYVGERGWELYAPTEYGRALWDTLWEAGQPSGVIAAGGGAFESLRLEKGYRLWGADIHTEYNPYEAGLGFAVNLKKRDFQGREALMRAKESGITRKLCCLTLNDPRIVIMGKEPILAGERVLGYVTSANYGYSVGKSIAWGYLPAEYATPGTPVTIQFFGVRHPATVTYEPLYDPENRRIRQRS
jgi:glycine cleavage system aminomethyltransferase T